jgi:dTDP-4-dehydrorhamnose reductase
MKRIMITGASGMLGTYLIREFNKYDDVEIIACSRKRTSIPMNNGKHLFFDIRDNTVIQNFPEKPDVIIHCAGLTDVDYCQRFEQSAWLTNVIGTDNMQKLADKAGARFIHISTNDVFGNCSNVSGFDTNDFPQPSNVYGRSKLKAEQRVTNGKIIRTSFYGWHEKSLPYKIISALRCGEKFNAAVDQHSNMMYAGDLAHELATIALYDILTDKIIHIACRHSTSRFVFARTLAYEYGLNENLVIPVPYSKIQQELKLFAPRSMRAVLDTPFHYTTEDGIRHMKAEECAD